MECQHRRQRWRSVAAALLSSSSPLLLSFFSYLLVHQGTVHKRAGHSEARQVTRVLPLPPVRAPVDADRLHQHTPTVPICKTKLNCLCHRAHNAAASWTNLSANAAAGRLPLPSFCAHPWRLLGICVDNAPLPLPCTHWPPPTSRVSGVQRAHPGHPGGLAATPPRWRHAASAEDWSRTPHSGYHFDGTPRRCACAAHRPPLPLRPCASCRKKSRLVMPRGLSG